MRKLLSLFLLCLIIASSGCLTKSTPAPAVTTQQVAPKTTVTTIPDATTITTTRPTTQPTTPAPSKPLASTVMLSGTGDSSGSFNVAAPGRISINAEYGSALGEGKTGCTKTKSVFRVALVGSSIDSTLIDGPVGRAKSAKTTFNIVTSGSYMITATGCYGWKATVSNA